MKELVAQGQLPQPSGNATRDQHCYKHVVRAEPLVKPFVMAMLFDVRAFGAKGLGVRSQTDTSLAQNMNGYEAQNVIEDCR